MSLEENGCGQEAFALVIDWFVAPRWQVDKLNSLITHVTQALQITVLLLFKGQKCLKSTTRQLELL